MTVNTVQISVKDGNDLYKEIRVENALQDGNEVALKKALR